MISFDSKIGVEIFEPKSFGFDVSELGSVFQEFYEKNRNMAYDNVASMDLEYVVSNKALAGIYEEIMSRFSQALAGMKLDKLWLVKSEAVNVKKDGLPFIPHIDRKRYLKVMIYVDKVTEENGAFYAVQSDPELFESQRISLKKNYKEKQENRVRQYSEKEYRCFSGEAGSIILFDTNCPHFAGNISGQAMRRVFRFDFERPSWNRYSALKRLVREKIPFRAQGG